MKKINMKAGLIMCVVTAASMMQAQAQWSLTGNAGTTPGTNFIGTTDAKSLQIRTNNQTRIAITSSGNVGIGTSSPTSKLQLRGTGVTRLNVGSSSTSSSVDVGIIFDRSASGVNNTANVGYSATDGLFSVVDGILRLQMFNNGNTAFTNGNVGIGTTAPAAKLDVIGRIRAVETGVGFEQVDPINNVSVGSYADAAGGWFGTNTNHPLNFYTNFGNPSVTLSTNGNFGVGTATPSSLLDVQSSATTRLTLGSSSSSASIDASIIFDRSASGANNTANVGLNGTDGFYTVVDGIIRQRVLPNGNTIIQNSNVGIGTTPGGQFQLSLDQGRKPSTSTWTIVSDERLKNIDGAYTKGLKEIMQLNTIAYHYKNVGERKFEEQVLNTQAVGFSAQDVQKVFPEAVGQDADGFLNLNIHSIIIAQVNAIKELGASNEAKNEKIAELQRQLDDMQDCLQSICNNSSSERTGISEISVSSLQQNQPNPFSQSTVINYNLSNKDSRGMILIRDINGNLMKSINVNGSGKGQVTVNANELSQGTYTYTLVIEGKSIDTKLMVITK